MIGGNLRRLAKGTAAEAVALRLLIVGLNFTVMMGLAAWLGLSLLGPLMVNWGLAVVGASLLSMGVPLALLRLLSQGEAVRQSAVLLYVTIYPAALTVFAFLGLQLWSGPPWPAILAASLALHLSCCAASIMRAFGSQHMSMILRDCCPQIALGAGALSTGQGGSMALLHCAIWLAGFSFLALIWCRTRPDWQRKIARKGVKIDTPYALWSTSVIGTIIAQVDIIVGGVFMSDAQTGLYALLRRLTNLVALPVSVATWVTSVTVARAFEAGDTAALERASQRGSRIALLPGLGLLICGLLVLTAANLSGLFSWGREGNVTCLILLGSVTLQLAFAATFTVATLSRLARFAALARLIALGAYLSAVCALPSVTPIANAVIYSIALGVGSLFLWGRVKQHIGIDTSALALWGAGRQGGIWKTS